MEGLRGLPFFEVLVVDNASTDKTREIVEKNFPSVKILNENRKGVTKARNRGGFEAKGDMLVFFDADVSPPKDWLKKVISAFKKEPDLAALSGPYHYQNLSFLQNALVKSFYLFFPSCGEVLISVLLKKGGIMQGGNLVVKKEIFDKVKGFDEEVSFWGDEAMLARKLIKYGKIKFKNNIWVESSSRRLQKEGFLITGCRGVANCIWPTFFGKPFTKDYNDIREEI